MISQLLTKSASLRGWQRSAIRDGTKLKRFKILFDHGYCFTNQFHSMNNGMGGKCKLTWLCPCDTNSHPLLHFPLPPSHFPPLFPLPPHVPTTFYSRRGTSLPGYKASSRTSAWQGPFAGWSSTNSKKIPVTSQTPEIYDDIS
jgi:hypothetical protein